PYSILYYTDESPDFGRALRSALAAFEAVYDVDKYSLHSYWNRIHAPIQLHQGGADDAVPIEWSDELAEILRGLKTEDGKAQIEVSYYRYPEADHNLQTNWGTVIERDLVFFRSHLESSEASGAANN